MRRTSFALAKRVAAMEGAERAVQGIQSKKQTSSRVFGEFARRWASWLSWEEGWRRRCS